MASSSTSCGTRFALLALRAVNQASESCLSGPHRVFFIPSLLKSRAFLLKTVLLLRQRRLREIGIFQGRGHGKQNTLGERVFLQGI